MRLPLHSIIERQQRWPHRPGFRLVAHPATARWLPLRGAAELEQKSGRRQAEPAIRLALRETRSAEPEENRGAERALLGERDHAALRADDRVRGQALVCRVDALVTP
jgi:hypothetical protein